MSGTNYRHAGLGLVALLAGVLLVAVLGTVALAQRGGTLEGRVTNGTSGGPGIGAGITVTLHAYQDDTEIVTATLQATTDAAGRFRFEGLPTTAGRVYLVNATYLGVTYTYSQALQFGDGGTSLQVPVTVYETTDQATQLTIDRGHLIAESLSGPVMRVTEVYLFGNNGDRTYVGQAGSDGRTTTVRLPLPEGAVGIAFTPDDPPDRYVQAGNELLDSRPVPPGRETSVVFFSYHLGTTEGSVPLDRSYAYPVGTLDMLLVEPGLSLTSSQVEDQGPQVIEGRQYHLYGIEGLAAGTPLAFSLVPDAEAAPASGQSAPAAGGGKPLRDNQGALRAIGVVLAVAAVAVAAGYALATRRGPAKAAGPAQGWDKDPAARRLIAELADLQEAFESGGMDEDSYQRERAARMEALRAP